jgi:sulfotransferase family protein
MRRTCIAFPAPEGIAAKSWSRVIINIMNKIFGIGLSKTGTTSLAHALEILGFRCADYPNDQRTLQQLSDGDYRLEVVDRNDAMTDTPAALCYQQLDELYPKSRFILTERANTESWLRSIRDHWHHAEEWTLYSPTSGDFIRFMNTAVYGLTGFNNSRFTTVYKRHAQDVREYFKDRPDDLLIIDITEGQGWTEICRFLGRQVPDITFPHSNSREEKKHAREWMSQLDAIFSALLKNISKTEPFLLIDQYGLAETKIEADWNCIRSLSASDGDKDFPFCDIDAVEWLNDHLENGINTLVIWRRGCDWLFESFPLWREFLSSKCVQVHRDEWLAIYRQKTL